MSVFVRLFTFLLLHEKVCAFSSVFLFVLTRTKYRLFHIDKNFVQKFCLRTMRDIEKKFFGKLLPNMFCDSLFIADIDIKKTDEKEHSFSRRKNRRTEVEKSGPKTVTAF